MFNKKSLKKYKSLIVILVLSIPMFIYLFFSQNMHEKFFIGIVLGIVHGTIYAFFFQLIQTLNIIIHIIISPIFGGMFLVLYFFKGYVGLVYFLAAILSMIITLDYFTSDR